MAAKGHIEFAALTDQGLTRHNNEDSFMVLSGGENAYVVILADGMGGHKRGELASSIAVKYVADRLSREMYQGMDAQSAIHLISEVVEKANVKVYLKSLEDEANEGMGTTLTVGIFLNHRLIVAHVGDCRACLLRRKDYLHLTVDHTLVQLMLEQGELTPEEAIAHPNRNMVTRALGTPEYMFADIATYQLEPGDRLLFSSDGLHDYVHEVDIKAVLREADSPRTAAQGLVDLANGVGGADNVTVIVGFV